jgi:hypothetical protein
VTDPVTRRMVRAAARLAFRAALRAASTEPSPCQNDDEDYEFACARVLAAIALRMAVAGAPFWRQVDRLGALARRQRGGACWPSDFPAAGMRGADCG